MDCCAVNHSARDDIAHRGGHSVLLPTVRRARLHPLTQARRTQCGRYLCSQAAVRAASEPAAPCATSGYASTTHLLRAGLMYGCCVWRTGEQWTGYLRRPD